MALLLMRTGKQILRLSSSAAAVAARSQQQLSKRVTAAAATTSFTRSMYYVVYDTPSNYPNYGQNQEDDDFEIPQKSWKSFFTDLFRAPPPPHTRTPFRELIGKFMDLVEQSKHCPEDRLPLILDDIRPVLKELLYRMTDQSIVKFVYEFARPAASSPPAVIDTKIKAMVDQLPSHVIHLFLDLMNRMFWGRYGFRSSYKLHYPLDSKTVVLTADVSHIGKEHLKLFVVENNLMVTGPDKDDAPLDALEPDAPAQLLAINAHLLDLRATVQNALPLPSWPYSRDEITASIVEEQGKSQLKIVVPTHDVTKVVADKPRVFQLNLTGVKTYYEFSGKS